MTKLNIYGSTLLQNYENSRINTGRVVLRNLYKLGCCIIWEVIIGEMLCAQTVKESWETCTYVWITYISVFNDAYC